MQCKGTEKSFAKCKDGHHAGCNHSLDVIIKCSPTPWPEKVKKNISKVSTKEAKKIHST